MGFVDELGSGRKALRLARGQHQKRFGIFPLQRAKGDQGVGLLRRDHASCNDDGRASTSLRFREKPMGDRRGRRKLQVVLQVAVDFDALGRRTECANPLGVLFALHEKGSRIRKSMPKKRPKEKSENTEEALITGEGTVGNTSTDEHHRNVSAPRFPKEVGPDFRLENNDDRGPNRAQNTANAKRPIQRKIENRIGKRHAFSSQRLPGQSSGRDDERTVWIDLFQSPGESDAGKRFADGNSMNPDSAGPVLWQFAKRWKRKTEALAKIPNVFAMAQALEQPVGYEQQDGKAHKQAVG